MAGLAVSVGALSGCASNGNNTIFGGAATSRASANRGSVLSAQDLEDALVGSTYLGCGGGGGVTEARELIAADLAAGQVFRAIDVNELGDDERVACPYGLGSLAPNSEEMQARLDAIENPVEVPTLAAFNLLEKHLGVKFAGVILGEIGPLSMAEGLSIAARLGVPALDADTVGRAVPEINQHSVRVAGHPLTPASGVTPFGDEIILQDIQDPSREEDVFRGISVVSSALGVVDAPITGAVAKSDYALVKGSLTLAMKIGAAVREAQQANEDPIEAARIAGGGYSLFEGTIEDFTWADEDGFLVGDISLAGSGDYAGQSMELLYKNEHLVARRDGEVIATCPDLITLVDRTTFEGVKNPDFEKGRSVSVLGYKSDPIWRLPEGLAVFNPRYFGYDVDYIPIEQRLA